MNMKKLKYIIQEMECFICSNKDRNHIMMILPTVDVSAGITVDKIIKRNIYEIRKYYKIDYFCTCKYSILIKFKVNKSVFCFLMIK